MKPDDVRTPELVQEVTEADAIAAVKTIHAFLKAPRGMSPTRLRLWTAKTKQAQRTLKAYNRQRAGQASATRAVLRVAATLDRQRRRASRKLGSR